MDVILAEDLAAVATSGHSESRNDHQYGSSHDSNHHQGVDEQNRGTNEHQWDPYGQHRQSADHPAGSFSHHGQPSEHSWDSHDQHRQSNEHPRDYYDHHRQPSEHSWDAYDQHRQSSEPYRSPLEYLEGSTDHLKEPTPTEDLMALTDRSPASGPCKSHRECPFELSCFVDGLCRDPCKETLNGLKCGENAICKTYEHIPVCACPPDFNGDPLVGCYNL